MENGEREQRESKRSYIRKYSCIFTRKYVNTVPPYICYVLFTHDKWILKKDKYLKIVSRWSAKNRYHRLANISKLLRYFLFVHYFHSANNRQIAARYCCESCYTDINSCCCLWIIYEIFYIPLSYYLSIFLSYFLFLFYRPKTIIRRNRINQEQKSRPSYSPISLARNWDFPVCICNPMQIAGVACRFRYRVQNTVVRWFATHRCLLAMKLITCFPPFLLSPSRFPFPAERTR